MITRVLSFIAVLILTYLINCAAATTIQPLAGASMVCLTIDPVTLRQGINVCQWQNNGTCLSPDGKWTIPCSMTVTPILTTSLQMVSEAWTSTLDYTYTSTQKVDFSASANWDKWGVKAAYSRDSSNYYNTIMDTSTTYVVSTVDMKMYGISTDLLTAPLNQEFRMYIQLMDNALTNNDWPNYNYWLSQFLSNVPFAVVTYIETGGRLQQTEYVYNSYVANTATTTVQNCASASCGFGSMFSAQASDNWGESTNSINTFKAAVSSQSSTAVGGPYISGMSQQDYQQQVEKNPGVLTYSLTKTNFWLNTVFFPNVSTANMNRISTDYNNYWNGYIANNSYPGCTDSLAVNFNGTATVEDGSCQYEWQSGSAFGGVYGIITDTTTINGRNFLPPSILPIVNPLTGGTSCPAGTFPICGTTDASASKPLWEETVVYTQFFQICVCSGSIGSRNQHSFGLGYTPTRPNPATGLANCPTGIAGYTNSLLTMCSGDYGSSVASFVYGGAYYLSANGGCNPNTYTSACSCPSFAQNVFAFSQIVQSVEGGTPDTLVVGICYGNPQRQTNPNPGRWPALRAMILPNGSSMFVPNTTAPVASTTPAASNLVTTTPGTTTPGTTTPRTTAPVTTVPGTTSGNTTVPSRSSPTGWIIFSIIISLLVVAIIAIVFAYAFCRTRSSEYTPLI